MKIGNSIRSREAAFSEPLRTRSGPDVFPSSRVAALEPSDVVKRPLFEYSEPRSGSVGVGRNETSEPRSGLGAVGRGPTSNKIESFN